MNGNTGDEGFHGRILKLRWTDGHPLKGMKVDMLPISVGGLRAWREKITDETDDERDDRRTAILLDHVVEWNLRYRSGAHKGEPLPVTLAAFMTFEQTAVTEIVQAWLDDGRVPPASKEEDPENGEDREPIDPLVGTSDGGLPTAETLAAEALIHSQVL